MAWTWDHYSETTATTAWHRSSNHPLDRFIVTVDRMFYVSAIALAASVIAILVT